MNQIHEFSRRERERSPARDVPAAKRDGAPFLVALSGSDPLRVQNTALSDYARFVGTYDWARS